MMNLLRGPGHKDKSRTWWDIPVQLERLEPAVVPSKTPHDNNKAGYTTRSGIIKSLVVAYLLLSKLEDSGVQPLLQSSNLLLIPTALATDGLSIKPGLLVGLLIPVSLTYVKENPVPDPSFLRGSFIVEAKALILTMLDNKLSLPVGNDYTRKKQWERCEGQNCLLCQAVSDLLMVSSNCHGNLRECVYITWRLLQQLLLRYEAELCMVLSVPMNICCNTNPFCFHSDCTSSSSVSQSCQRNGQAFVEPPLRAYSRCLNSGTQCVKLVFFVWSADCKEATNR